MGVSRARLACSFYGLLFICCTSITYALPAAVINIGIVTTDLAYTSIVKVLARIGITSISDTCLSTSIWVGEVVAVIAFSVLAPVLSFGTGVLNACS